MDHPHAYALRLAGTAGSFKGQGPAKARYTGLHLNFLRSFVLLVLQDAYLKYVIL